MEASTIFNLKKFTNHTIKTTSQRMMISLLYEGNVKKKLMIEKLLVKKY